MSVNKYKDHVLILPEDDANRQLANGFLLEANGSKIQILPVAGGWQSVCEIFVAEHVSAMRQYQQRRFVLLLDFDNDPQRAQNIANMIPDDLKERVFLLGVWSEPEALKRATPGSYEDIGLSLAKECRSGEQIIWKHDLLQQNAVELDRLRDEVCGFLF
jgi:hypothetical protein